MKRLLILIVAMFVSVSAAYAQGEMYLGCGIHYWRTLDDIEDDRELEDDGIAYLVSLQLAQARLFRIEADVEIFPDGFGGSDGTAFAPQAYLILGSGVYAGIGIGTVYASEFEDKFSEPFYAVRGGLNIELLPGVYLDVNANYHFLDWENIDKIDDDIDTDTLTLAAIVRFQF